ncbi:hypothetical protein BKA67DRAFT_261061 [Truncatella angustata]|uniref:Zn(2)-C6 fungal-type domain-containing protein n=1 Tax=Truncatella angustata TaxID=152316 RepID=A0A9P8UKE5_9PEZI|nr:uncharacterized protein BKA67DRAFT_261061 [Truncatella angustata]KAH6653803.1 hypothetical protein BKA67DRAFT_261061 [Truncatella angustata]
MDDQGSQRSRTVIASRSCDACRLRKVRCDLEKDSASCRRCTRLELTCTFMSPRAPRGPKRRAQGGLATSADSGQPVSTGQRDANKARNLTVSPAQVSPASAPLVFPTDGLCPRILIERILQDYLTYVYPLIPVVNMTFRIE